MMANRKAEIDLMNIDMQAKWQLFNQIKERNGQTIDKLYLGFYDPSNSDIELVKGGKDIEVTLENLQEYIDLVIHSTFHETINMQLNAF